MITEGISGPFGVTKAHDTTNLIYSKKGINQNTIVFLMSDSKTEVREHQKFWAAATGDILITGLGLGLSHGPLVSNPDITSVTIIEKYQDVITLVWDQCDKDDRFNLIHTDANTWEIPEGSYWDCIWIDHYVHNMSGDSEKKFIESMTEKYSPHCNWIGFWLDEQKIGDGVIIVTNPAGEKTKINLGEL